MSAGRPEPSAAASASGATGAFAIGERAPALSAALDSPGFARGTRCGCRAGGIRSCYQRVAQLSDDDRFRDDDWPERADERAAHVPNDLLARRYFDRARRADAAGRRTDSLLLYASGLRHDPGDDGAYRRLFETAMRRFREASTEAPPNAVARFDGPSPIDRFVAATLAWSLRLDDPETALVALEAAARAGLARFGQWHAPHVYLSLWQSGIQDRGPWRRAEDACAAVQAWDWMIRVVDVLNTLPES